jgi:hypothetical protein
MADETRGIVELLGEAGADGGAVVRVVRMPDGLPADAPILAAVLAAARAAAEASRNGGEPGRRPKSWKQAGRLEAMGTDSERRSGLR